MKTDFAGLTVFNKIYLLEFLESRLGSIDTWPSYIIRFLFVDTPNPATVRRAAVFSMGITSIVTSLLISSIYVMDMVVCQ